MHQLAVILADIVPPPPPPPTGNHFDLAAAPVWMWCLAIVLLAAAVIFTSRLWVRGKDLVKNQG